MPSAYRAEKDVISAINFLRFSGRCSQEHAADPARGKVELEHYSEPEGRHARVIRDQAPVAPGQRPRVDQLVRLPLSPLPVAPSIATTEKRLPTTMRNRSRPFRRYATLVTVTC